MQKELSAKEAELCSAKLALEAIEATLKPEDPECGELSSELS